MKNARRAAAAGRKTTQRRRRPPVRRRTALLGPSYLADALQLVARILSRQRLRSSLVI